MSKLQKYYIYAKKGSWQPVVVESADKKYGTYYRCREVDDARAADKARIAELEGSQKNLMDRLEKINLICWSNLTGPAKLAEVKDWSAGFAPVPANPPEAT